MKRWLLLLLWCVVAAAEPDLSDEALLPKLRQTIGTEADYFERNIKRVGNRTITLDVVISTDGDYEYAKQILPDYKGWPGWALQRINEKPDGSSYIIQILSLTPMVEPSKMLTKIFVDLPVFKQSAERGLKFKSEIGPKSSTVSVETLPSEGGFIESLKGIGRVFPAEGRRDRVWFYFQGDVKLSSWLVYEALPEKLLKRETGDRIRRIMENYTREEDRVRGLTRNQSPRGKKATPDVSRSPRPQK